MLLRPLRLKNVLNAEKDRSSLPFSLVPAGLKNLVDVLFMEQRFQKANAERLSWAFKDVRLVLLSAGLPLPSLRALAEVGSGHSSMSGTIGAAVAPQRRVNGVFRLPGWRDSE